MGRWYINIFTKTVDHLLHGFFRLAGDRENLAVIPELDGETPAFASAGKPLRQGGAELPSVGGGDGPLGVSAKLCSSVMVSESISKGGPMG
jgi:hypothetical protein